MCWLNFYFGAKLENKLRKKCIEIYLPFNLVVTMDLKLISSKIDQIPTLGWGGG